MSSSHYEEEKEDDAMLLNELSCANGEEMLQELHKHHLLRMETTELLKEIALPASSSSWWTRVRDYTATIQGLLKQTPSLKLDADFRAKTKYPLEVLSSKKSMDASFEIKSFRDVMVLEPMGSHGNSDMGLLRTSGNAHVVPTLDFLVRLPTDMLKAKDYLEYAYLDKLNMVFWHVYTFLHKHSQKKKNRVGTVEWRCCSDGCKPYLFLTPPAEAVDKKKRKKQKTTLAAKPRFCIQLFFGLQDLDWVPAPRLFPNRCNLKLVIGKSATPMYNFRLAECAVTVSRLVQEQEHVDGELPSSFRDAVHLFKVWCLQRGLLRGHDGWTTSHIVVLLLYLYRARRIGPRMACMDILVVALQFLVSTNLLSADEDGPKRVAIVMPAIQRDHGSKKYKSEQETMSTSDQARLYQTHTQESPLTDYDQPTLVECFLACTDGPVFLDSTMKINYWARLSPSFIHQLVRDAKLSLEYLHHSTTTRPFVGLFMESTRFWTRYDAYLRIPLKDVKIGRSKLWGHTVHDLGTLECICRGVHDVLTMALGDRIRALRILTTGNGAPAHYDSDQIPTYSLENPPPKSLSSPVGQDVLVLGISLNPTTAHRLVDRGPPADDTEATAAFLELWGPKKAQLRRFMDGAIVHAVAWNNAENKNNSETSYTVFENDDKTMGGIVERIVQHVLELHFFKPKKNKSTTVQFALRNMLSLVDGVALQHERNNKLLTCSMVAHKSVMSAYESLSQFLRQASSPVSVPADGSQASMKKNRLGLPLSIDSVEPLCPALRYTELFPPLPHPSLGGDGDLNSLGSSKVSGAIVWPLICIQIRFGPSSKWPTDLKAMGAAKTAMLIQLANGIEQLSEDGFEGGIHVTRSYIDLGFKGYSFRIVVRADPELKLLQSLVKPNPMAATLLTNLMKDHVVAAMHHSTILAVHTLHPSFASVVRLARRWVACHMLSDFVPFEAIELVVTKVYTDQDLPVEAPGTPVAGFMRFLKLLASFDWARNPLIVDPQDHLSDDDRGAILLQFESARGPNYENGPAMYIISPNDRQGSADQEDDPPSTSTAGGSSKSKPQRSIWIPTFTQAQPESVTLSRAASLAKRSYDYLMNCVVVDDAGGSTSDWHAVFQESETALKSYSVLFRVDPDYVVDRSCSSTATSMPLSRPPSKRSNDYTYLESSFTRSMTVRHVGHKALRRRMYRNLNNSAQDSGVLYGFLPIQAMMSALREKFGSLALFLYNDLAPDVIAVRWRPTSFVPQPLSIMRSSYKRPLEDGGWQSDSLVVNNYTDVLREIDQLTRDIIVGIKVLDDKSISPRREDSDKQRRRGKKRRITDAQVNGENEDEASSSESD